MTPKIKTFFKAFITAVFFLIPGFLFSQDMITDRPDKTESVETVGKNKFQIETGVEYAFLKYNNVDVFIDTNLVLQNTSFQVKTLTAPTTLLRFGILSNVELRLGFDFEKQSASSNDIKFDEDAKLSLNPPTLGAKVFIAKGKDFVPDFAVIGAFKLPEIGDEDKKVKHFVPEFVLSFANEINDKLGVGYNLGVEWQDDMSDKEFFYSVSFGMEVTPRIGAFAEIYGNIPASTDASNQNLDGGFSYLIKNNLQVDLYGGLGLTADANNFILGTGISLKF